MRIGWVWAAAALLVAGAVVALVWSVLAGAERSLRGHESRVREEIAAVRVRATAQRDLQRRDPAHRRTLDVLRGSVPAGDLDWVAKVLYPSPSDVGGVLKGVVDTGSFYPYEFGGRRSILGAMRSWREAELSTPERLLLTMDVDQEFSRGQGTWETVRRLHAEVEALGRWADMLRDRELKPDALSRMAAGLDRLMSTRPTIAEEVEQELVWFAQSLILELRQPGPSDEPEARLLEPGWRDLYSRTLRGVRLLNAVEAQRNLFREAEAKPAHLRAAFVAEAVAGRPIHSPHLRTEWSRLHARDAEARMLWTLARTATAVALHRAEKGVFPESLDPAPVCPMTGRPLLYRPGHVASPHADPELRTAWPLKGAP